jgi:hypothetical protein
MKENLVKVAASVLVAAGLFTVVVRFLRKSKKISLQVLRPSTERLASV